ncbi:hypothetical protein MANES_10G043800v8 [Manihot esculenta]|uniref:Uncharacterized protein n=1 Tax=Manihot esculenta TaxID=3983 RepID=A0A2C9V4F3_MANES|nr:hypothetical protein MANES_10G043800v8 [Manihot esculenta]
MERKREFEEFEDAPSLCDLSDLCDHEIDPSNEILGSPSTQEDFFEFTITETNSKMADDNIIFCGKVISSRTEDNPRNPPFSSSSSSSLILNKNKQSIANSFSKHSSKVGTFRSPSTNSRKQKVMIGLAPNPTKMEINDLRERQNGQTPSTMSPAVGSGVADSGKSGWGLIRLFRARSHGITISSMLPKTSVGCVSLAMPCID